jgi:hypothetical protein
MSITPAPAWFSGCLTVGVAGLVLGGGFGSYSRLYGTAAVSLPKVEIVTASLASRLVYVPARTREQRADCRDP